MALFGSRKGLKWWGEVSKAEAQEKKAKARYDAKPTKTNYDSWQSRVWHRQNVQAAYYD